VPEASPVKNPDSLTTKANTRQKGIPLGVIVEYRQRGFSLSEIGKLLGVTKQTLSQRLKPLNLAIDALPAFKAARADVFALYGRELLHSLTPEDIKRMPPGSRVLAACQLYDKERLERGQASEIIEYSQFDNKIEALDAEIVELENKLADAGRLLPMAADEGAKAGGVDEGGPDD